MVRKSRSKLPDETASKEAVRSTPKAVKKIISSPSDSSGISASSSLMDAVYAETARRGASISAIAKELNVSAGYLFALKNGPRQQEKISKELAVSFAKFLGVSVVGVWCMAGTLRHEDFIKPMSADDLSKQISAALGMIKADPEWAGFIPDEAASDAWSIAFIRAYERATGKILITDSFIKEHQKFVAAHSK